MTGERTLVVRDAGPAGVEIGAVDAIQAERARGARAAVCHDGGPLDV